MQPVDYLLIAVAAAILGLAAWYIIRAKKKGKKCIGCPDGCASKGGCGGNCAGCNLNCSRRH